MKRLRLRKPVFNPRPVHLWLPDVEEVNRFVDDLKKVDEEARAAETRGHVEHYRTSSIMAKAAGTISLTKCTLILV